MVTSKGVDRTVFVVNSHLIESPLDLAKEKMQTVREVLANPYVLLGIIAVIFAVVFRYTFKKGASVA